MALLSIEKHVYENGTETITSLKTVPRYIRARYNGVSLYDIFASGEIIVSLVILHILLEEIYFLLLY